MEWRYRYFELRADVDRRLIEGVAVRYGDVARLPWGEESFIAGAFGDVSEIDILLNFQHERARPLASTRGGGLTLTDTPDALLVAAELPRTRDADDALELVRAKIMRGLSIEYGPVRERQEGRRRIVETARLGGLGLVDRPAFPASTVAARAEIREGRRRRLWL